jgi:predicted secreted protein
MDDATPHQKKETPMRQFLVLAIVASMSFGERVIGEKEATTKPDSSNPVYVNYGDTLKIRLPIKKDAGYRWSILGYDNGATEILGQSTIEREDDSEDREGGPEYQVYKLKVKLKKLKTTRLTFIKLTPDKNLTDPPQVMRFYLMGMAKEEN